MAVIRAINYSYLTVNTIIEVIFNILNEAILFTCLHEFILTRRKVLLRYLLSVFRSQISLDIFILF